MGLQTDIQRVFHDTMDSSWKPRAAVAWSSSHNSGTAVPEPCQASSGLLQFVLQGFKAAMRHDHLNSALTNIIGRHFTF